MEQQRKELSRRTDESLEAALEDFESGAAKEARQQVGDPPPPPSSFPYM